MLQEIESLKKRLATAQAEADRLKAQEGESSSAEKPPPVVQEPRPSKEESEKKPQPALEEETKEGEETKTEDELQKAREELDARSVYVGNVDYSTTPEELHTVFQVCLNFFVFEVNLCLELWNCESSDCVDRSKWSSKRLCLC